jgi:hypothetical protein
MEINDLRVFDVVGKPGEPKVQSSRFKVPS